MSSVLQSVSICATSSSSIGPSAILLSGWLLSGLAGWGPPGLAQPASAQVVADDSLGTVVRSSGTSWVVEAGTQAGENLFHSFEQFSVPAGGAVRFQSGSGIRRILSRVTGGSPSQIQGAIAADADLFLLNPNGILFGPGTQLNISDQFIGTTAEQIEFGDGRLFSSALGTASEPTPLLSLSAPVGLQFGNRSGDIEVLGSGHRLTTLLPSGLPSLDGNPNPSLTTTGHLALLGRNITFSGGSLQAEGQRVELGAIAADEVELLAEATSSGWRLGTVTNSAVNSAVSPQNGQLRLTQRSLIDAGSTGPLQPSGSIHLKGDRIHLSDASVVWLRNLGLSNPSQPSHGGSELRVEADSVLTLTGFDVATGVRSQLATESLGPGSGGTVRVSAPNISLSDGAAIASSTFGPGRAGAIEVQANRLEIGQLSPRFREFLITSQAPIVSGVVSTTYRTGAGGPIQLSARELLLTDGGNISNLTVGAGDTGSIAVTAQRIVADGVSPSAPELVSGINSVSTNSGNAQNIDITVGQLTLTAGAGIISTVSPTLGSFRLPVVAGGLGDSGDVTIRASEFVDVIGLDPRLGVFSSINTSTFGDGQGGNTSIQTPRLRVLDGATIASTTLSTGNAGAIAITAEDIQVAGVNTITALPSSITVSAPVLNSAFLEQFQLPATPTGTTGKLMLSADRLRVEAGGVIAARHRGQGDAGSLEITANQLRLDQGLITAATVAGQGGSIQLNLNDNLQLSRGSEISAESGGLGGGGNIDIRSAFSILLDSSKIVANARQGKGGNINMVTQSLLLSSSSQITASSELGVSGTINISTPEGLPSLSVEALPEQVQDLSQFISQGCKAPTENKLVASGRGGLPAAPFQPRSGMRLWRDRSLGRGNASVKQMLMTQMEQPATVQNSTQPQRLFEAQAIQVQANGAIQLLGPEAARARPLVQRCLQKTGANA